MNPCPQTHNRILTAKEIAKEWKVHHSKIYRLAKSGELKSYLIGGCRRFKESDVWAFFENQVDRRYAFGKEQHNGYSCDPEA